MSTADELVSPKNQHVYAQQCVASKPPQSDFIKSTIRALELIVHPEGGYYHETDRDNLRIPNPFIDTEAYHNAANQEGANSPTRSAMTTIHYFLTPDSPIGHFHRNKARTVHTLHRGRGRYIVIHAGETDPLTGYARRESFIVGHDVANGERLQWIVEGGKYKATVLLPDSDEGESKGGLLISETVVPGFEFCDHDFLDPKGLERLLGPGEKGKDALGWLLLKNEET